MKKKSRFKYIGIDPGKSGALVCIDEYGTIEAKKCPDKVFDMSTLFALSVGDTAPSNVNLLMERVWANNWIKWVGCPKAMEKTKRKNWLKDKAKELYPEIKRVTLATSDAILICHYAKEEYFCAQKHA